MANKDFIVKNGIVVNTAFSANSLGIYYSGVQLANTTAANNAGYLGGQLPAYYAVNTTVYSTFAQNTSVYSTFAQNTSVYSTFAQNTSVYSTFQTMSGLSANVATLTANNTSFVGSVPAPNVVSNAQLSANLLNYQTTTGLNANIASYLPTYSGNINAVATVNASTFQVGSSWTANSTRVVFGTTVGLQANGSIGSANQALFSNGTSVYWANVTGGTSYTKGNNGAVGDPSNANNIFRINSNTQTADITISAGENALAAGPISITPGYSLIVQTGGKATIV